jgi:hypothetical protein
VKGFVLVLVVDESQMDSPRDAFARVFRSYEVTLAEEIDHEVETATQQAVNQLRLGRSAARVLGRAAAAGQAENAGT